MTGSDDWAKAAAAFLLDCIDHDEQTATAASPGPWLHDEQKQWQQIGVHGLVKDKPEYPSGDEFVGGHGGIAIALTGAANDEQSMADADFIAEHNPVTVRADCAAKRIIVNTCLEWFLDDGEAGGAVANEVLTALLPAYADRTGYDEVHGSAIEYKLAELES